jgi:uncharacterized protein DUF4328
MNGSWRGANWPPANDPYRPLDSLTRPLIWFLVADVILTFLSMLSNADLYSLLSDAQGGNFVTVARAQSVDERQATLALLELLVTLLTAGFFFAWFRRAYRNLWTLGVTWYRFKPGWAIGSWFVPLLNLIRPKEIANDIWRASDPELPLVQDGPGIGRPVAAFINWWWGLVIFSSQAYRVSFTLADDTLDEAVRSARSMMAGDALWTVAGVLLILYVKRVTDRQTERAAIRVAAYSAGQTGYSPPPQPPATIPPPPPPPSN